MLAAVVVFDAWKGSLSEGEARADLGEQSDAGALGRAVQAALDRASGPPGGGEPAVTCGPETRATYGRGLGSLVYAGRLQWQGAPAVALAYRSEQPGGGHLDHRLFVVSREGCGLLVTQSL